MVKQPLRGQTRSGTVDVKTTTLIDQMGSGIGETTAERSDEKWHSRRKNNNVDRSNGEQHW